MSILTLCSQNIIITQLIIICQVYLKKMFGIHKNSAKNSCHDIKYTSKCKVCQVFFKKMSEPGFSGLVDYEELSEPGFSGLVDFQDFEFGAS